MMCVSPNDLKICFYNTLLWAFGGYFVDVRPLWSYRMTCKVFGLWEKMCKCLMNSKSWVNTKVAEYMKTCVYLKTGQLLPQQNRSSTLISDLISVDFIWRYKSSFMPQNCTITGICIQLWSYAFSPDCFCLCWYSNTNLPFYPDFRTNI